MMHKGGKGKWGTGHGSGPVAGRCAGSNQTCKSAPHTPIPGSVGKAVGGGKTANGFKGGKH
ncbi:MAG: hypothetical protein OXD01_07240 [Gammaproteobacteria bacterium]|nr:hypothetical protein [Gammaproteobacteria bacterium]